MTEKPNRLFVSIGVSHPEGDLEKLPGAIKASERMAAWAQAQGYKTLLINDELFPEVTTELLRLKLTDSIKEITNEVKLDRIVVFFAGHGSAMGVGDQYWILSNWQTQPTEAIRISAFQRMLEYYGPKQVAIIGDACQEFSPQFIDLLGSAVLHRQPEAPSTFELDQFFAVDVGKQAFMIKAANGKDAFCIFTEVLLDALEGDAGDAYFEPGEGHKAVTSQSLARHLMANVEREASKYGVRMSPRPLPGFYTDTAYLKVPYDIPDTQPQASPITGSTDTNNEGSSDDAFYDGENAYGDTSKSRSVPKVPLAEPRSVNGVGFTGFRLNHLGREIKRKKFNRAMRERPNRSIYPGQTGIILNFSGVADLDISNGRWSMEEPNLFHIDLHPQTLDVLNWSDALISLQDGRVVSACVVENFITEVSIVDDSVFTLFHRKSDNFDYVDEDALSLLAKAHAGLLDDQDIIDIASSMRMKKHEILTMGCIAAQFYDVIRDVASLQSMAAFYMQNNQPIPLDIVLYGGGKIYDFDGQLYADVPDVPERIARTPLEARHTFSQDATRGSSQYPIAGRVPWMRQAWSAVATSNCDESAFGWRELCEQTGQYLGPGSFTATKPEGRESLFALAGISAGFTSRPLRKNRTSAA